MNFFQAIIMGIVQGLTEFLPISSSAHLRLTPALLGFDDPGVGFTAVIQLGTVLAVLIYFAADLKAALIGWIKSFTPEGKGTYEARMGWAVFWGTIPVIVVGVLLRKVLEDSVRALNVVAFNMILMGIVMYAAEKFGKKNREKESVSIIDGLVVGLFQCLALVPGMSRSGSTMTGGFLRGFNRDDAVRLSFLMSVPAVTGAGLFELFDTRKQLVDAGIGQTVVATVVSFVVGYACIAWLLGYIKKSGVLVFTVYRILLGLAIFGLLQTGKIHPNSGNPGPVRKSVERSVHHRVS